MTYRIPPTGKPSYKDSLQGKSLSYDHNNLIRLYEILLANSFGNKDYIKKKYKKERKPKPPEPNFGANLSANVQQTEQNGVLIHYPPVFYGSPLVQKNPPISTYHPHGPNNMIHKPIPRYPKSISCHICNKSFHSPMYLEIHQLLHLSKQHQEFACNICNEIFSTSGSLDIHKRLHEKLEPLNLSDKSENDENNGKSQEPAQPVKILKNLLTPCDSPKNDENISKSQESAQTIVEVPLTPPLSCDSLKDDANGSKSPKAAETTVKIPFKCQICSKSFKYYTSYKRHRWIHERRDRDIFSCAQCNKTYTWKQNLKAHIKLTHFSS